MHWTMNERNTTYGTFWLNSGLWKTLAMSPLSLTGVTGIMQRSPKTGHLGGGVLPTQKETTMGSLYHLLQPQAVMVQVQGAQCPGTPPR